jgi:hypothetical protein
MHVARKDWAEIAEAWERSGELQRAFAARHGVPVETLRSWIYRRRREPRSRRSKFVEVRVSPAMITPAAELAFPNGLTLRLAPGTDPTWVSALAKSLLA